ncbi:DUF3421 domain-containing protein [Catenuloplanes atrovinosus]|uniref:Uncharacterized protein n=1 Tax=Catenuloplanes atrovinosus TaxID=137266 RepID=A0AAE3YQX9_9ACTN|nr:DUF3421 domain-containing protein [Catenuloplanes atrovinosus]MDR7276714.1 hypothetical protein [Catenuloplanes atrovinosus]
MTDYRWETASGGRIPDGAIPHGYDDDGSPLWVCRAWLHGGLHPGKVRPGLGMAGIAWGGEEVGIPGEYEVLMDRGIWGIADGGDVPGDAYPAGHEHHGITLYVARAAIDGNNLQIGKVREEFRAANIGYGNEEHTVRAYEVLLRPNAPIFVSLKGSAPAAYEPQDLTDMVPQSFTPMRPTLPAEPLSPATRLTPTSSVPVQTTVAPVTVDGNRITVTVTVELGDRRDQ